MCQSDRRRTLTPRFEGVDLRADDFFLLLSRGNIAEYSISGRSIIQPRVILRTNKFAKPLNFEEKDLTRPINSVISDTQSTTNSVILLPLEESRT